MTPTYALKKGVRYRYYVSVSAMQSRGGAAASVHRVAADTIEAIVVHALQEAQRPGDRMDDAFAKARSDDRREDDPRAFEDLVRATSYESSNSTNRFPPGSDAEAMRALFEKSVLKANKDRLRAAQAGLAASRASECWHLQNR